MLKEKIGYSYNDLTIVPSVISNIFSRSECDPYIDNDKKLLPIFTAPMASVVNENNLDIFLENGIIPILPRNIDLETRKSYLGKNTWVALSLKEFIDLFVDNSNEREVNTKYNICVDIANGHMKSLYTNCIVAKEMAKNNNYELVIMTGNIANSETYEWICTNIVYTNKLGKYECAIDYIRIGIGSGAGCITSSNCSVHYPQASLIDECYNIKKELKFNITKTSAYECETTYNYEFPKIIADGGIRNYDHVIKALALGADYVMIGSLFAQCIESAGEKGIFLGDNKYNKLPDLFDKYKYFERDHNNNWYGFYDEKYINNKIEVYANEYYKIKEWLDKNIINEENTELKRTYNEYMSKFKELKSRKFIGNMYVKFFGMASADGQKSISGQKTKTAEGITKWLPVKYTLVGWVENMKSYLCSAMSYTDCKTIDEFIGKPYLIVNSISEINAVNK